MKKTMVTVTVALALVAFFAGPSWGSLVETTNPGTIYWNDAADTIAAKARNGDTGFEAVLGISDLNPGGEQYDIWNGPGTPYWIFGNTYKFTFAYSAASGTATFSLMESDGALIRQLQNVYDGSGFSGEPNYAGKGFYYIQLNYAGNGTGEVNISNLIYNGAQLGAGSYLSGALNNYVYFKDSNNFLLTEFTIAGDFVFTGNGNTDERPRFEIDLGSPAAVPIPGAVWLLGSGLLGLIGIRRRFKS